MDPSSRNTVEFCLQFIKNNVDEASQRTMCRTWIKTAMNTLASESNDFVISELESIDKYFSGADAGMTSVDVLTKVDTVSQLLG